MSSVSNQFNDNRRDEIKLEQEVLKYLVRHKKYSVEYNNFIEKCRKRAIDGTEKRHFWLVGHEQIASKFKNLRSQANEHFENKASTADGTTTTGSGTRNKWRKAI